VITPLYAYVAKVEPRVSAQTDLAARFTTHIVPTCLGNTVAVAAKHYLRVTPGDFERAVQEPWQGVSRNRLTNVHKEKGREIRRSKRRKWVVFYGNYQVNLFRNSTPYNKLRLISAIRTPP